MSLLLNSAIERPEKVFYVELVIFGTITRSAMRRTIGVLAQTAKGAKKICKSRYRRCEVQRAHEANALQHPLLSLGS